MPLVNISVTPQNLTPEQKKETIRLVSEAVAQGTGKPKEKVWVILNEIDPDNWGAGGRSVSDILKDA